MLKLVQLEEQYHDMVIEMMDEWTATGEQIVPYAIRKVDYHHYQTYKDSLNPVNLGEGIVPDTTYFCLDTKTNRMVGAINIRHYLNEKLLLNGGHIGDGVRPSQRKKGIATQMIAMALLICGDLGLDRVLMVCDKSNVASAKSILANGGVLENEITVDGVIEQRYWIDLSDLRQPLCTVSKEALKKEGCLLFSHIQQGFETCHSRLLEGDQQMLYSQLAKLLKENGPDHTYLDFYYGTLSDQEKEQVLAFLSPAHRGFLSQLVWDKQQVYYAYHPVLFEIAFLLSFHEVLFSTFYFAGTPATIWGNYERKFVLFTER